jgi:hypothetical protein
MGLFSKTDPIEDQSREIRREIEQLRAEIRKAEADTAESTPRFRSTVNPRDTKSAGVNTDLIFEEFRPSGHRNPDSPLSEDGEAVSSRDRGIRAWFRRWKKDVGAAPVNNPKLIKLMSVGNIHGLRPLRAEKRQARNRFLFLFAVLLVVLYGLFSVITHNYYY